MFAQNDSTTPNASGSAGPAGKRLFGVGMLAVGIAAGAMFAPASFAGAQDDGDDATETDTARSGHRQHRGEVLESLGIDADAVRAGLDADQSLVEIAIANGVTEIDLIAAIEADIGSHLAEAVESGRITQEQADEKLTDLTANVTERVNTPPSERPDRGSHGNRGARFGGSHGNRGARFGGGEVLEDLGLTVEDIQAGREAGQTLAETAAASGVSEAELVDAIVAQANERADAAVEAGRVDADQVAERLDGLEERVTERVNAEPGDRSERPDRGERGVRGRRGAAAGDDVEESSISF